MKKELKLELSTQPPNITPFTMTYCEVWQKYDSGELTADHVMLLGILFRRVSPFTGRGTTNYLKLCAELKWKPSKDYINKINKMVITLRDEHQLIWFNNHSGSRDFIYAIHNYKLSDPSGKTIKRWVDLSKYFVSESRGHTRPIEEVQTVPRPSPPPHEQSLPPIKTGDFSGMSEILEKRRQQSS